MDTNRVERGTWYEVKAQLKRFVTKLEVVYTLEISNALS